jgi:2-dehydro-3-deoxy-L-rhamnonate dehydrogenase (NAD+)
MSSSQKVVLITGGTDGLGRAAAVRLAELGYRVFAAGRSEQKRQELDRLAAEKKLPLETIALDVCDDASVYNAVQGVLGKAGAIDVLINNAGIAGPNVKMWEFPPDAFARMMHVNVEGTFYCCRAVVPQMIARNYGRIVNISSIAGKEGNPNDGAYSTSKAAQIALTKSLAKELASHNISVNCVTPSLTQTALAMTLSEEQRKYILAKVPRGRMLRIEEAASLICWAASEENSFTTGATFDLSGGRATY